MHSPTHLAVGLGAYCLDLGGNTYCPTIFPAPPTLGASFNSSLLHLCGEQIGLEARAWNNHNGACACAR